MSRRFIALLASCFVVGACAADPASNEEPATGPDVELSITADTVLVEPLQYNKKAT